LPAAKNFFFCPICARQMPNNKIRKYTFPGNNNQSLAYYHQRQAFPARQQKKVGIQPAIRSGANSFFCPSRDDILFPEIIVRISYSTKETPDQPSLHKFSGIPAQSPPFKFRQSTRAQGRRAEIIIFAQLKSAHYNIYSFLHPPQQT